MVIIVNVEKMNALLKLPVRKSTSEPGPRGHDGAVVEASRQFDLCTGSADADVAVLRGRPPEQREEYAVDEVQ